MANTARIEIEYTSKFNSDSVATINPTDDANNVSNLDRVMNNPTVQNIKGFHISGDTQRSPLDGSCGLYSPAGYTGYCSSSISNANGQINVTLIVGGHNTFRVVEDTGEYVLNGEYLFGDDTSLGWSEVPKYLTIKFDKLEDAYPAEFIVSNSENTNIIAITNAARMVCVDLSPLCLTVVTTQLSIAFTRLSRPFSNLKIQKVSFAKAGIYTDNIIRKFKCSEQLMDTTFNINPCVLSQYAEITFKDKYGEFKKLANDDSLSDNLDVDIYIDDKLIGTYVTDEWSVQAHNTEVALNCVDSSNMFDRITVPRLAVKDRTLDDLLTIGFDRATVLWDYIDIETEQYCASIIQLDNWAASMTLDEYFKKICMLGLIRIYWHVNKFIVARCY